MLGFEVRTVDELPVVEEPKVISEYDLKEQARRLLDIDEGRSYVESWMFRVPGEQVSLILSAVFLILIGYFLSLLNVYVLVSAIVIGLGYVRLTQSMYLGSAVRVHKSQFPDIYALFEKNAKRLGVSKANLYITQNPNPNAYTIGLTTGTVVLTSAVVEAFTKKELDFVLGHELGHFKAGHTVITTLVTPIGFNNFLSGLVFGFWKRKTEYSADRCGLILTKDVESAISALLKLTIGAKLYSRLDAKGYIHQIEKAHSRSVGLSEILVDHPLTTNRIRNLVIFWDNNFRVIK